ncbi:uncharacterized protein LOC134238844, partial [Saccostrea cucullata]|uniref:uncharacterized protein LOC134238844 n=1 Tax=Saccostrea cuccullata TaxID=36930 RepID=UPI002ED0DE6C
MTTYITQSLGITICSLFCVCFFQISVTFRTIGINPEILCAQDVLVLIENINGPLCKVLGETQVNFHNITQDEGNCTIPCAVTAVVRVKKETDKCSYYYTNGFNKPETPTEKKEGYFYFSKHICCYNFVPNRYVYMEGKCDFNIYRKTNVQSGKICTSDEQCYNTSSLLRCIRNHCSCAEGYIEYHNQCIRGLSYGEECQFNEQCSFYGGVCSRNNTHDTCSCKINQFYNAKAKICYE